MATENQIEANRGTRRHSQPELVNGRFTLKPPLLITPRINSSLLQQKPLLNPQHIVDPQ